MASPKSKINATLAAQLAALLAEAACAPRPIASKATKAKPDDPVWAARIAAYLQATEAERQAKARLQRDPSWVALQEATKRREDLRDMFKLELLARGEGGRIDTSEGVATVRSSDVPGFRRHVVTVS